MNGLLLLGVLAAMGVEPAPYGEPFRLPLGESVAVADTDLSLTFVAVERDSRCPKGVQCVRAGEAIVVLSIQRRGETSEMRFEVPPGGAVNASFAEHTISLELEPEAVAGKRIERDDYVAIVTVAAADEP